MKRTAPYLLIVVVALSFGATSVAAQELDKLEKPDPVVPEIFTLEGEFVRIAYNNEGFVTLGYKVANTSVGDEWLLLEMGITVQRGVKGQTLKRSALSLQLPDGSTVGLPTQKQFNAANLQALDKRASMVRDSINYFPAGANQACTMNFFADAAQAGRRIAFDQVELNPQRACIGRIYFHIPTGIDTGQYYLNVAFENSMLQVPFRIFTKKEEKEFRKKWKGLKKEHEQEIKEQYSDK